MQSLRGQPYQLDEDKEKGYKQALNNNQLNLALHYLTHIVDDFKERVEALEDDLGAANKEIASLKKKQKKSSSKSKKKEKKSEDE